MGSDSPLKPIFKDIKKEDAFKYVSKWDWAGTLPPDLAEQKADYLLQVYLNRPKEVWVMSWENSNQTRVLDFVSDEKVQGADFNQKLQDALDESIRLYEQTLQGRKAPSEKILPKTLDDAKQLKVKIKLTQAKAQKLSRAQAKMMYQSLLEEAIILDRQLNQLPYAEIDHSLKVWVEMQKYLDPQEDQACILETEAKLKKAGLKRYHRLY